jgi:hypothetical protein
LLLPSTGTPPDQFPELLITLLTAPVHVCVIAFTSDDAHTTAKAAREFKIRRFISVTPLKQMAGRRPHCVFAGSKRIRPGARKG